MRAEVDTYALVLGRLPVFLITNAQPMSINLRSRSPGSVFTFAEIAKWTEQWVEQGIERGIEQGRVDE